MTVTRKCHHDTCFNVFAAEVINDWFTFLPSKDAWVVKFTANTARMASNFNRELTLAKKTVTDVGFTTNSSFLMVTQKSDKL